MKYKVVVVDDHLLIAKAIAAMVQEMKDFEVLYEAENGSVLLQKFKTRENIPDIVLLDISMPIMNGFETAQWLHDHYPGVKILVLSMQDDEASLIRMIKLGAKGYLHKNVHPAELEKALINLIERGMYFPQWATAVFFQTIAGPPPKESSKDEKLSNRELEFLHHVCSELTYKEIADLMCCSPRTVEGYRDALFEKLNIKTRVGLAMYAVKIGIVKVE
ncbi:response regulator transcription factor [Runella salmonicolor]|uniref:Response regulator transcription factor n=1 Tax=Runella salmonicolor TaxID=2950278 RepID=A0ABT1FSJ0_9BACT|nr:response regulator transcription factor [Runella salmonicolor]MCP1384730.1 response regulator transcription factor [Runella salmonicolor]